MPFSRRFSVVLLIALLFSVGCLSKKTSGESNQLKDNKATRSATPQKQEAKAEDAEVEVESTDSIPDKYTRHSVVQFSDKFDDSKLTRNQWVWPQNAPEGSLGGEQGRQGASFFFSGDMTGKSTLRTKEKFEWPLTVNAELEKDHKCSSHFIVVSTSDKFTWDWGTQDDAIKFVWNCDTKYILGKGQPKKSLKSTKCATQGRYNVKVVIKGGVVSFEDDKCETLTAKNLMPGKDVYVYIGADQDTPGMKSRFFSVDVSTPPKAKSLPQGVVFGDDFTFMNDTRPRMWKRRQVYAKVDDGCGAMPGSAESLRFYGAKRIATSRVMDMHRGGKIETCARYGSDSFSKQFGGRCQALDDLDGMEIQWSSDGLRWKKLARYIAHQFAAQFQKPEFSCITHNINWKENKELMTPSLYLRWVQISEVDRQSRRRYRAGQVRGNFALGRVMAHAKAEPPAEVVMKDDLSMARGQLWKYPPTGDKMIQYGYNNGLWFQGSLTGQRMMRTKNIFQMGMKIRATVDKSSKCNSHVMAISRNKDLKFAWGAMKDTWVFAWNCDTKYIYAPDGTTAKTKCNRQTRYNVDITVEKGAVVFRDGVCRDLLLPTSPGANQQLYVYIGADDDSVKSKARFLNFEVSKMATDDGDKIDLFESKLLDTDFRFFDEKNFVAPKTGGGTAQFGYLKEGSVWFSGDFSGLTPMRSVRTFPMPFAVTGKLTKDSECSSQFIVISDEPKYKWGWGPSKNAIKFAWNCDDKYIYGTSKKQVTKAKCDKKGDYKFTISVFKDMISFGDDECGLLTVKNGLRAAKELYVYVGADQDQAWERSKFSSLTVTGPFVPPTIKDRRVLMQDNFDFKDSLFEPMWTMEETTGQADKACGAVFGASLHMKNSGPRIATSKPVDATKGIRVDFALRYGGSSAQCGKMTTGSDGVEVQASADGGKTWKRMIRYDSADYGNMLKNFKRLSVTLDENNAQDLLTDTTMIRWIQPQNNKACCGHWALDNVAIWTLEEPGEIVIDDSFGNSNASAWVYPTNERDSKCQYGLSNNVWFSGDCSGQTPMHSKRLLTAKQGVTITADVDKDGPCANHFFAISPQKGMRWVAGKQQNNVVKIGWNCDEKYIMTGKTTKKISCGALKKYEVTVKITKGEISFNDNVCEDLTMAVPTEATIGPFYVYMGADRFDTKGDGRSKFNQVTIEQAAASPFESFTVPIYSDDFLKDNTNMWVYPPAVQNKKAGKEKGVCSFKRNEGAIAFHGDCVDASPLRLKDSVSMPVTIFAEANKNAECSSHYIVIAPHQNYKWSWEPQPDTVKFAWNCDDKYIYGPTKKRVSKTRCAMRGMHKMEIKVEDGLLTFKDGQCAGLTMRNPLNASQPFYIYVGADQDDKTKVSEFNSFSVEAPEQPPKLENGTVLFDNFDFHDNIYAPMWLAEETSGRVDKECGSVNGKALRFFNQGTRRATTKLLDISYGAQLNFFLKFGNGEGPTCMKMKDIKDGVKLQYRTEVKSKAGEFCPDSARQQRCKKFCNRTIMEKPAAPCGENECLYYDGCCSNYECRPRKVNTTETTEEMWKTIEDYSVAKYGAKFRKQFTNVSTIIINWDKYSDAMTESTRFRWVQSNENARACCDHWALDSVKVDATPYPKRPAGLPKDTLILDSFDEEFFGANAVWWNMFETTGRASDAVSDGGQSMLFKNKGDRKITTKPFDILYGGASLVFSLQFTPAGKLANVTNDVGVELQFSVDGESWKRLEYYQARRHPDAINVFKRFRIEMGGDKYKNALSRSTSFRFVQRSIRKSEIRMIWSLDEVELHTGSQRIGLEDIDMKQEHDEVWCYQPRENLAPYSYRYPLPNEKNVTRLSFTGDIEGKSTVRSHVSFRAPLEVVATVDKTDECSNHFIVISRRKYFSWNWKEDKHSIKFAWRCDRKVLVAPGAYKSTSCPQEKEYKIHAKITKETISFTDSGGCAKLEVDTPENFGDHDYYVYIGAAQPTNTPFHPARTQPLSLMEVDESKPKTTGAKRGITRTGAELTKEQRVRLSWPKECREIYCPSKINPVCGSDSKTYDNECMLMLERCKRGKKGKDLKTAYAGACRKFAAIQPAQFSSVKVIGRGALIQNDDGSRACPQMVHCKVSEWSKWSNCSTMCDNGVSTRQRLVIRHPKHGGMACPALNETKKCHVQKCDCGVDQWSKWGTCDKPCGGGEARRFRNVVRKPLLHGLACPALNESKSCNNQECAVVGLPFQTVQNPALLPNAPKERFLSYNRKDWCYQDKKNLQPYAYGYVGNSGGVWFTGSDVGRSTMRSRKSYSAHKLTVEAEISKNTECANHFVVLSPRPYNLFKYEPEAGMIKAYWKCDKKVLTWPTGSISTNCPKLKNYEIKLRVEGNNVVFEDDECETLTAPMGPARHVFMYIGANYGAAGVQNTTREEEIEDEEGNIADDKVRNPRDPNQQGNEGGLVNASFIDLDGPRKLTKKVAKNIEAIRKQRDQKAKDEEAKEEDEEDLTVKPASADVAAVVAPANKTEDELRENEAGDEPNRAVFKWVRVSGQGSLMNRENGTTTCPDIIDCRVSIWSAWTNCTEPCDGGNSTRTRQIYVKPRLTGLKCPALNEIKMCNTRKCDCGMTKWSRWSFCTKPCGGGMQSRKRTIFREPMANGLACGAVNETRACNAEECAVLSVPELKESGLPLVKAPFDTLQKRNEKFWCYQKEKAIRPYAYDYLPGWIGGGLWFSGNGYGKTTLRAKNSVRLPLRVDFEFERDQTCSNQYIVLTSAERYLHGWAMEPETVKFAFNCAQKQIIGEYSNDRVRCPLHIKPGTKSTIDIDVNGTATFTDSNCDKIVSKAGLSLRGKDFFVYVGASIPPSFPSETKSVFNKIRISGSGTRHNAFNGTNACPMLEDCEMSSWTNWSKCSAPCGGGNRSRTRSMLKPPAWGGRKCGPNNQTVQCNTQHCGQNCDVTEWSTWSNCTKVCGGGLNIRTRNIFTERINGTLFGRDQCPPLNESKKCNTQHCGKDCVISEWGRWSFCNAPCGGGGQKRIRSILVHPVIGSHAGKQCPRLEEERACNTFECPMKEGPKPIRESKCSQYKGSCKACTADPDCGYCPSTGDCFLGNAKGPIPRFKGDIQFLLDPRKAFEYATNCSAWQFAYCTGEPCRTYSNCKGCMSDAFCGWCGATGTCTEGDAAGSYGEFCPRGWIHSPMHTGVGVRRRNDLILSPAQVHQEKSRLGEFCEANDQETRKMIQEKMESEHSRVARLKKLRETCMPCSGKWPNCQCDGVGELTKLRPLSAEMVAREADEAIKVDTTLPRNGTEEGKWDHGKGLKKNGAQCFDDGACSSGSCADRCCKPQTNGCSGHGVCDAKGECICEEGFTTRTCGMTTEEYAEQGNVTNVTDHVSSATGLGGYGATGTPAPPTPEPKKVYDTNSTEGILNMARDMMSDKVKEVSERAREERAAIKESTKTVNSDIDVMQKALNEKLAVRQTLAREESDTVNKEINAKQSEEKMKFEESRDKINAAQEELVRKQNAKKVDSTKEANNNRMEAERLAQESRLALEKSKRMEDEKASAEAEETNGKKTIAQSKSDGELRNARIAQKTIESATAQMDSSKTLDNKAKAQALKDQASAAENQQQEVDANRKALEQKAQSAKIFAEAQKKLTSVQQQ